MGQLGLEFEVRGCFYSLGDYPMRSRLDITRVDGAATEADLVVIMMNPGSSRPLPGADSPGKPGAPKPVEPAATALRMAKPDNTQYQIMRLMQATGSQCARLLNLSDLQTSNSAELYRFLASPDADRLAHSIFSPARAEELAASLPPRVPVVYAWGVNPALMPLARMAAQALSLPRPAGLRKAGTDPAYYHPLPPVYARQIAWVQQVAAQLRREPFPA